MHIHFKINLFNSKLVHTSTLYFFAYFSSDWNGFFNWTMTYRQDSDFYTPYGKVHPISSSLPSNLDEHIQQFGDENKGTTTYRSNLRYKPNFALRKKYYNL